MDGSVRCFVESRNPISRQDARMKAVAESERKFRVFSDLVKNQVAG